MSRRSHMTLVMKRDRTPQKERINALIREEYGGLHDDAPIPFLCECTDELCYRAVWLTGGAFDDAREVGTEVVSPMCTTSHTEAGTGATA
jgi:hypothetical protein